MVAFAGPADFAEKLYPTFAYLANDPSVKVRQTLARGLHEIAQLVWTSFKVTKIEVAQLFAGKTYLHMYVLWCLCAYICAVVPMYCL
jgi:hypothetical protein